MATENPEDMAHSLKELKKMGKDRKKELKKAKKRGKIERKIAKKEVKLRKKGVFLEEAVSPETIPQEEIAEEVVVGPWVRKSTENMPYVERKIDMMAKRREQSGLHDLFEEKFGESLMTPETFKEYELSEAERARLEKMGIGPREASAPSISAPRELAPSEGIAVSAIETVAVSETGPAATAEPMEEEAAEKEMKPIYHPFQLWLYTKYGKDKKTPIKILILIPSVILFVLALIPRIVIFLIMTIIKKIKGRRAEKKLEKAEKVPSEA